jgi:Na+-driven multidrug efflux pump
MTAAIACCNVLLLWQFHADFYKVFAPDSQEVLQRSASLWLISALAHICDCLQFVFQGIFSACGKNHVGFVVVSCCLVGIATVLGALLAFTAAMGASGLMLGLALGLMVAIPSFAAVVHLTFDWHRLASVASRKVC